MITETFRKEYDPARDHAWHLSCWLAPNLQAWCVHERSSGRLMALASGTGDELPARPMVPERPASVSFTAMPEVGALVPESTLEPGSEMHYLKLVHGSVPTGLLRDEPIGMIGAQCIYLHDEAAERNLLQRFPNARPLPLQGTLVHHALTHGPAGAVAVLHRSSTRLDIAIADKGKLLLSNTFHATVAEDVLYYTLFCLEQCGLSADKAAIRAGGTHLTAGEEHLLSLYAAKGPIPSTGAGYAALEGLELANAHHWTALIEQFTCAS
ncbi:MAG: DUF3822 family protein [Bacteroidetes bacterium]|nr:DUF3822 family protein [Bacteroidota bacterium]